MPLCHSCQSPRVETLIDFGAQALSNRYLVQPYERESLFSFVLSQCSGCGLIQIANPVPPTELKPRFDWITYNEQEGHLDNLVEKICRLLGVRPNAVVGAVSFKDDSTVARLKNQGFASAWRLAIEEDLGLGDGLAGLETIQAQLTPEVARRIAGQRGRADVLIARHILEHAHAPEQFLAALRELVKPDGYVIFEVPDCAPALQRGDYTMFWEEHVSCFTPETFQAALSGWGFSSVHFGRYVYSNENSLVAITQLGTVGKSAAPDAALTTAAMRQGRQYADAFADYRGKITAALEQHRRDVGKIAVFGAGHLSCAWINFLRVEQLVEFVVDDHPKKKGMFMPGSKLAIRGSSDLWDQDIRLCLLSLSPESETKVIQKNQAFLAAGGRFACIFPGKPNSFATACSPCA